MDNMILIDLETQTFSLESGIHEVAALVIENYVIKDKFYLGELEDDSQKSYGYGYGYKDLSNDASSIEKFKKFVGKYNYPLVAHNGAFDRRFLTYYNWLDEEYPFFDSIRAIRYKNPKLFSYSIEHLKDFLEIEDKQTHEAMDDVELLYKILYYFKPDNWVPIGVRINNIQNSSNKHYKKVFSSIKEEFEIIKNIFTGKNIVFTGKGPYTRNELMELAKKCGADITSNSITKKTNLLVVGEKAGSKLQKAHDLGIEIMTMDEFYNMVKGVEIDEKEKVKINKIVDEKEEKLSNKLEGKVITLFPMKTAMANKVASIIEKHNGTPLYTLRKNETTLLVYQSYAEGLQTVQRARKYGIPTMTLGAFNKYIIELQSSIKSSIKSCIKSEYNMLQERIEELSSGILYYQAGDKVNLIGFMSEERLNDYYEKGIDCHFSSGIYEKSELNWGKIKTNALFIESIDGKEVSRHQFEIIKKDTIKFKDLNNKMRSKIYTIRKCKYTEMYNLISREDILNGNDKKTEENNKLFNNMEELNNYFVEAYGEKAF